MTRRALLRPATGGRLRWKLAKADAWPPPH